MASERSKKKRLKDNKGVEDGTVRKGKGGKNIRRWNKSTGRWEKVSVKGAAKDYGSVSRRGKDETTVRPESSDAPSSRADKNVGLGGTAATYKRPGVQPAKYKVVNVKPQKKTPESTAVTRGKRDPWGLRTEVVPKKSGKKIPIGKVVLRGNPPKKYKWNGERFERYTGSRQPSSGK